MNRLVASQEAPYNDHMTPQEIMDLLLLRDIAETLDQMPLDARIASEEAIGSQRREWFLSGAHKRLEAEEKRIAEDQQVLKNTKDALKAIEDASTDTVPDRTLPDAPFTLLFWGATYESYKPPKPEYIAFRSIVQEAIGPDYNLHIAARVAIMLLKTFPDVDRDNEVVSELHPGKGLTITKPGLTPDQVYGGFGNGDLTKQLAFKALQVFTKES